MTSSSNEGFIKGRMGEASQYNAKIAPSYQAYEAGATTYPGRYPVEAAKVEASQDSAAIIDKVVEVVEVPGTTPPEAA